MRLSMDEIDQAELAAQLAPVSPEMHVVYRSYLHPRRASAVPRRVVVLNDATAPDLLEDYCYRARTFIGNDDIAAFLLDLLVIEGERVGDITYASRAESTDYVLVPVAQGYRLVRPTRIRPRAPALPSAAA